MSRPSTTTGLTMRRYNAHDLHKLLCDQQLLDDWKNTEYVENQALHCPYYVPLEGRLGVDWGVIVNPESRYFGRLMFEHDDCGCPEVEGSDYRHIGDPDQDGDMWDEDWKHECGEFCDDPCERAQRDGGIS